jgi:large subunit ribosomal protein L21
MYSEEIPFMFAVVEIQGKQYRLSAKDTVTVDKLPNKVGDKISFDKVLLVSDNKKTTVGAPSLDGHTVEAKVLEHIRGDKVTVFKKKRRKGYTVKRGHRQDYTTLKIEKIIKA